MKISQQLERAEHAFERGSKHVRKEWWQMWHVDRHIPKTPIFIGGCHRSGTDMFKNVLDLSPVTKVYGETRNGIRQKPGRLTVDLARRRVKYTFASHIVFKPLRDAQRIDDLLDAFPNGRGVWMYRNYYDTAELAVKHWGGHQKDILRRITEWDWSQQGDTSWRHDRLTDEVIDTVCRHYSPKMSEVEGAAVFWYVRHSFVFSQALAERSDLLLARYKDLVLEPQIMFKRYFDFLGIPFHSSYVDGIFKSSLGKPRKSINPAIETLCKALQERLDARYEQQVLTNPQ